MAISFGRNGSQKKTGSSQQSIRPEFLSGKKNDKSNDLNSDSAAKELRSVEQNAGNDELVQAEDSLAGARESEETADGLYTGSGKTEGKGKGKGFLKGKGPIGLIIGLILGVGGVMGGAQMFQPFSLLEQFRETFNSMQTSANMRSNVLVRYQMDNNLVKNPIKNKFSIFGGKKFSISKSQKEKLSRNGIDVDDDFEGSGVTVMKYKDESSGRIVIMYPDAATGAKVEAAIDAKTDMTFDGIKYTDVTWGTFDAIYDSDPDVYKSYNSGSLTWRGAIANWFGSLTEKFLGDNILTRNLFKDFRTDPDSTSAEVKAEVTDLIAKGTEEIKDGGVEVSKYETETDGKGNETVSLDKGSSGSGKYTRADVRSDADVKAKLDEIAAKYKGDTGSGISGAAQQVTNYACLVFNFIGGVSLLVSANEAIQIIHLVTAYFEAIDKVKAGDGDTSPINDLANSLNEKKGGTYSELKRKEGVTVYTGKSIDSNFSGTVDNGNVTINSVDVVDVSVEPKTAMESAGIVALYSGGRVNTNDPSVKSFNVTSSLNTLLGSIGTSMISFESCAIAKMAANLSGVVETVWEIGSCIVGVVGAAFTFGAALSACAPELASIAIGIATSVSASLIIAGVISVLTPVVGNALTRDLITNIGGEDLGNALTSGANMYLGNAHRSNGGSLASSDTYVAYEIEHQKVVAENARYERMVRDPLDATSKYTFLGVLLTQAMNFATASSLFDVISSTSSAVSSSIVALSPTALASNINDKLIPKDEYEQICPYLASINVVGDAFCNPYTITDVSTIGDDPSEVVARLYGEGNFLSEPSSEEGNVGNVQIDGGSDLAKYIVFCDNRTSAFGIADQNIANAAMSFANVDTGTVLDNFANPAIGAIPIVGDGIDVVQNYQAYMNVGYISGESCVTGNSVSGDAPSWEKAKDYQRFIEDQSLMESMGLIEESAVTAFLDEYYEQNPLDNSYEGILARYSGMEKEDVIAILDILDYGNYIAQYDASTRYAFGTPVVEGSHEILFNNENIVAENTYIILLNEVVFADVRNRSFVV